MNVELLIAVAGRSKAWTVFARSNAGIMGSNPTWGIDVCVRLFCVCVVLCVGSGLATGWFPVQGVLPPVYSIKKLKKRPSSNKRHVEPLKRKNVELLCERWIDTDLEGNCHGQFQGTSHYCSIVETSQRNPSVWTDSLNLSLPESKQGRLPLCCDV
jgi:hypothetical protein